MHGAGDGAGGTRAWAARLLRSLLRDEKGRPKDGADARSETLAAARSETRSACAAACSRFANEIRRELTGPWGDAVAPLLAAETTRAAKDAAARSAGASDEAVAAAIREGARAKDEPGRRRLPAVEQELELPEKVEVLFGVLALRKLEAEPPLDEAAQDARLASQPIDLPH